MRGSAGIFIIVGIIVAVVIITIAVPFFAGFFSYVKTSQNAPPNPQSLSDDPKYKDVKEKYNLNEEQLQILSTVNPDDND